MRTGGGRAGEEEECRAGGRLRFSDFKFHVVCARLVIPPPPGRRRKDGDRPRFHIKHARRRLNMSAGATSSTPVLLHQQQQPEPRLCLWVCAIKVTHSGAFAILSGPGGRELRYDGGQTCNLFPLIQSARERSPSWI